MVDKQWNAFKDSGFAAPDEGRLKFDLTGEHCFDSLSLFFYTPMVIVALRATNSCYGIVLRCSSETERNRRKERPQTQDWDSFLGAGFEAHDKALAIDLAFDPNVNNDARFSSTSGLLSEEHRNLLAEKARRIEKNLPAFNYDITPREEKGVQIDRMFLEAFR